MREKGNWKLEIPDERMWPKMPICGGGKRNSKSAKITSIFAKLTFPPGLHFVNEGLIYTSPAFPTWANSIGFAKFFLPERIFRNI